MNLQVRDFAIVDRIEIEFGDGMTVLTGETGAGKSILVDALGLVLGERGSAQLVRDGAKRAEFAAEFALDTLPGVSEWLASHELDADGECLLRRVIGADGRSRAFINGNSVPLTQLKTIGELLLDIHGQHFHQSLGRRDIQRDLLDYFGGLMPLRTKVESDYRAWQEKASHLQKLQTSDADRASRLDLLSFQLQELQSLNVEPNEYESLLEERKKLSNGGRLLEGANTAIGKLIDDDSSNANDLIADALRALQNISDYDESISPLVELLNTANIQVAEAADSLRRYVDTVDIDPARHNWVEERLDAIQAIARKHRVEAGTLPQLTAQIEAEHTELDNAESVGRELEAAAIKLRQSFQKSARKLSKQRKTAATAFSNAVTEAMSGLGMPGGVFEARVRQLDLAAASRWGMDDIEFLISANPGQALQPMAKIASGGELSRMSLSIQVIASDGSAIPTMVFDEVDSGVGGGVAEMVGRRLQELGSDRQVLCVTHLPQVASLADHHVRISKVTDGKSTRTKLQVLGSEERVEEIARMLGGVEITRKTLAHAAEMLADAPKKRA